VQSADLGREVQEPPALSAEERAALDQAAREAGVKDDRLGTANPVAEDGAYSSLEEALAAGAPVVQPTPVVERVPAGALGLAMARGGMYAPPRVPVAREVRLPDFTRVEGIDLLRDCVMIDGMEFPIAEHDALDFKQYVVMVARNAILIKLTEATSLFAAPATPAEVSNGGDAATVSEVRIDGHQPGVPTE